MRKYFGMGASTTGDDVSVLAVTSVAAELSSRGYSSCRHAQFDRSS
jgi:hypothetical protein